FFFQAEDGIRAFHVTGVQTCALPIFTFIQAPCAAALAHRAATPASLSEFGLPFLTISSASGNTSTLVCSTLKGISMAYLVASWRSEERRVGEECARRGRGERGRT